MSPDRLSPVLDALRHPVRRAAVRGLAEEYLPLPVPSFATYLALSLFSGDDPADLDEFRDAIHRDLVHVHLPKLDDAEIVAYDPDIADGIIDAGPRLEVAVELVAETADAD